jgi:hypothetical protein
MKENREKTNTSVTTQSESGKRKVEKRMVIREKPTSMPNPVKGLTLSLYPMIKEH